MYSKISNRLRNTAHCYIKNVYDHPEMERCFEVFKFTGFDGFFSV